MISYKLMDQSTLITKCLHGGPRAIDDTQADDDVYKYLQQTTNLYGSSAVLAMDGDKVVGILRFYPDEVFEMLNNRVCVHSKGAMDEIDSKIPQFPQKDELSSKHLRVECIQVVSKFNNAGGKDYGQQGIGKQMIEELISWAKQQGWEKISYQGINPYVPLILWSGNYPVGKLQEMGFQVIDTSVSSGLKDNVISQMKGYHGKELQAMWQEYQDIDVEDAAKVFDVEISL